MTKGTHHKCWNVYFRYLAQGKGNDDDMTMTIWNFLNLNVKYSWQWKWWPNQRSHLKIRIELYACAVGGVLHVLAASCPPPLTLHAVIVKFWSLEIIPFTSPCNQINQADKGCWISSIDTPESMFLNLENWEFTQKSRVPQQTLSLGYPMFHRKVASTKRVSLESGLYQTGFTGKWPLPNCFHWKVAFS